MYTAESVGDTSPPPALPYPWVEYVSEEGWPYFYNENTGESSWERPMVYSQGSHSPDGGGGGQGFQPADAIRGDSNGEYIGEYTGDYSGEYDNGYYGINGMKGYQQQQQQQQQQEGIAGNVYPKYSESKDAGAASAQEEGMSCTYEAYAEPAEAFVEQGLIEDGRDTGDGNDDDGDSSRLSSCTSDDDLGDNSVISASNQSTSMIDMKNKSGQSVLHISAASGNPDAIELLVSVN